MSAYLKSCFHKVSEFLLVNWNIILGQPVTEQNWTLQSCRAINVRKVLKCDCVDVLLCPPPFIILHQPVLEEPQRFMRPKSNKALSW